ncbi:MAG TPA: DUF6455 family protein [Xanthobacteraceae bacterium]|nr:DUF6455 family protein [Xanthobacteraceae bacterium]
MDTIAGWARLWRVALGARNELTVASPREVARMAAALGVVAGDVDRADREQSDTAPLLRQMIVALGLDPDAPGLMDHAAMDELRRLCASCEHTTECGRDLAEGTAAENFYAYCPNAQALDSIYVELTFNRL